MEFVNQVRDLAEKALDLKDHLQTEEATKNALVMPFINLLGYNVFDPREVVPEFTADVGIKKGEKVDYAIMRDGQPIILIECKAVNRNLDEIDASQLYRYFSVIDSKFGILTNGTVYRFFTDLETPNRMDSKPFLEFDLLDIRESLVTELNKFTKQIFDVNNILTTASQLKYTREIKRVLAGELESPSEDFVKFLASKVYTGRMTLPVREQFEAIVSQAFRQFINDRISDRFKHALKEDGALHRSPLDESPDTPTVTVEEEDNSRIITTEEEIHALYVVKAALHGKVEAKRVAIRDRIRYCGILLDDNNRKPICRLHFNTSQKYIGLFDEQRNEDRIPIEEVDDILDFADRLRAMVEFYDNSQRFEQK